MKEQFRLCQVSECVSCGACCGLYNVPDAGERALARILSERTEEFSRVPRTWDDVSNFGARVTAREPGGGPFPEFHHCPYLGLVGGGRRVGCLLHPAADGNRGLDFRSVSHYGGMACMMYFCPTHRELAPDCLRIVGAAAGGWHLLGLVAPETRMLGHVFRQLEARLQRVPDTRDILRPGFAGAVRDLLELRRTRPFAPAGDNRLASYIFNDQPPQKPGVDYEALGTAPSPHDAVHSAIGSRFVDAGALYRADAVIDDLLDRIASLAH
ncbi:MAG: hypothetical protein ACLFOY_10605 [Desulfatibacillaceae bacterium]